MGPYLGNFRKFPTVFLIAHGGITQARQVREMAALLGSDLNEDDLKAIAQRARLDYFLPHFDAETTWNKLEWQWLNHVLVKTVQRQAGGIQILRRA